MWEFTKIHGLPRCGGPYQVEPGGKSSNDWKSAATPVRPRGAPLAVCALTGLATVGLFIAGGRLVAQSLAGTALSFVAIAAAFLLSLAAGASIGAVWLRKMPHRWGVPLLLFGCTMAVLSAGPVIHSAPAPLYASFKRELLLATMCFLVPGMVAGATVARLSTVAPWTGTAMAAGGGLAWPLMAWVLPHTGCSFSFYATALLFALAFGTAWYAHRLETPWVVAGLGIPLLTAFAVPTGLARVTIPEGWTLMDSRDGLLAHVAVLERPAPPGQPMFQKLVLDGTYVAGGHLGFAEKRLGHAILLLHAAPKRVLFLDTGTGILLSTAEYHHLTHIDTLESIPEVARLLPRFDTINGKYYESPLVKVSGAAPRQYLHGGGEPYDVIVAPALSPMRCGAAGQFTREAFQAMRTRLAPGGLAVQCLPVYEMDRDTFQRVIASFLSVFTEDAALFAGTFNASTPVYLLTGRVPGALPVSWDATEARIAASPEIKAFVPSAADLFASHLMGRTALEKFAAGRKPATDLGPAPRYVAGSGFETTEALVLDQSPEPPGAWARLDDAQRKQTAAYAKALELYLTAELLRARGKAGDEGAMVEALLSSYDADPTFRYARARLFIDARLRPAFAPHIFARMRERSPADTALAEMADVTLMELDARKKDAEMKAAAAKAREKK